MTKLRQFDIEWDDAPSRAEEIAFRNATRHICCLYEMSFPGLTTENVWKVIVFGSKEPACSYRVVGGAAFVHTPFDAARYGSALVDEKKRLVLDTLHDGVITAAKHASWPIDGFVVARDAVLAKSIVTEWIAARKASPSRKRVAEVRALFEPNLFRCWLEVRDRSGGLRSELAFEEGPSEWLFVPKLGPIRWHSSQRVEFLARDGTSHCTIDFED